MNDQDCVQFLQWSLPKLRMRWEGFRKVRGQVCKRINARVRELRLPDITAYRDHLEQHPDEWPILDSFCRVTISRFYRDKGVFQFLEREVIPQLAQTVIERGEKELRCWSVGCASGEEPYALALLWDFRIQPQFPDVKIRITATDADHTMIKRAHIGCYSANSLKELPKEWLEQAFGRSVNECCVKEEKRKAIEFLLQDVRSAAPKGRFHLVLCRNIVFTYFDEPLQKEILGEIKKRLLPQGVLVIGIHESLPQGSRGIEPWSKKLGVYRRM